MLPAAGPRSSEPGGVTKASLKFPGVLVPSLLVANESITQDECKAKYGLPVYYRFLRCFELMPLCAIVANHHGRYFCTHGGISPGLTSLDQIAALNRRWVCRRFTAIVVGRPMGSPGHLECTASTPAGPAWCRGAPGVASNIRGIYLRNRYVDLRFLC